MLVLTRKVDDRIQIGPNITITILRIRGRSVQIGIEAPGSVEVLRGELAATAELRNWADRPKPRPAARPDAAAPPAPPKPSDNPLPKTSSRRATRRCSANG